MTSMSASLPILFPVHALDKISQLPDDILLKVVSKLNIKDAVRMSILAKRWRYLWTWLTDLDFDHANFSPNNCYCRIPWEFRTTEYMNWVSQVVDAHRGACIRKFRVVFYEEIDDPSQIEKWVLFAFSKRVEELDLHMDDIVCCAETQFSLGIDVLKHPRINGIFNLKSLRISTFDITAETLEFILSHCHLLKRLYVEDSESLDCLHILSYTLKHLTLMRCVCLEEIEIDAVNLISFEFDACSYDGIVFKNVPKLVEVGLAGNRFVCSYLSLKRFSGLLKQLLKLSYSPLMGIHELGHSAEMNVVFPIVRQLTLTVVSCNSEFITAFINACPMLHELKLQVERPISHSSLEEAAKQLQEIELEDEGNDLMSIDQNPYSKLQKRHLVNVIECEKNENNTIHRPNLKVLEIVGVHGCDADIDCALDIITSVNSFELLIWDPLTLYGRRKLLGM
ncbi:hypothetical protein RND81_05G147400 [Saponaria officinalis]|uniref:F-box domain-containing protein n=1 Tax=Saponaria officinalis TaxID=3572 RepID=A0AAW1KX90_SAPOF